MFPYLILLGIVIAIITAIHKKSKARRAAKAASAAAAAVRINYPQNQYSPNAAAPVQNTPQEPITPQDDISSENETDNSSDNK